MLSCARLFFFLAAVSLWCAQISATGANQDSSNQPASPGKRHWAFMAPAKVEAPATLNNNWPRNPIDRFILKRLEQEKVSPSPEADPLTLLRRACLDLTGLPPTPEEIDVFLKDARPDRYERFIDQLLGSPHYGERWGRHWLDVARYADSNGYSIDAPRQIWKYRDWVIEALNRDLPFDQFVIEQIAGDLLPNPTMSQKIATGFHRNTQINEEGGIDKEQYRIESIIDRVNTTGTAFLGLTVGCAQCHDHKYDPISQKEYFQLFAFFNNADEPTLEVVGERAPGEQIKEQIEETEADLDRYIDSLSGPQRAWESALKPEDTAGWDAEVITALQSPPKQRNRKAKRLLFKAFKGDDPEFARREKKLAGLHKTEEQWVTTMVLAERAEPRESYVFIKGDFTRKGPIVRPDVPAALPRLTQVERPTRLDLARWLVQPSNPLTARVAVNRIWQEYFGRGLVETENDFGTQGARPSHPELLDWLAQQLVSSGWSLKAIHRLMVTSAAYRQSSNHRPELESVDPGNQWLARQSRLRLDAEIVRDVALSASGLLNPKIGGPSVFPAQPDGVMNLGQSRRPWKESTGADRYRRGLYTFFWRATPHPALALFDAPDAFSACTRRLRSNTPLQALTLLNDRQFYELAEGLATRVLKAPLPSDEERLRYAFKLCLARGPEPEESARLRPFLSGSSAAQPRAGNGQVSESGPDAAARRLGWITVARVLLNLDETITRE